MLAEELGVSETTATVLVRRGLDEPDVARGFFAAEPPAHDPLTLGDMAVAVERIRAAVAAGERICVHGDYDVDGISATAVAVLVLRELGANVEWRLPSRFEEGYGLAAETIERLAEDGVDLVLTVDCGFTAVWIDAFFGTSATFSCDVSSKACKFDFEYSGLRHQGLKFRHWYDKGHGAGTFLKERFGGDIANA